MYEYVKRFMILWRKITQCKPELDVAERSQHSLAKEKKKPKCNIKLQP